MVKRVYFVTLFLLFVVPATLFGGEQVTAVINFDEKVLSIVDFGFTGNTVTSMDTDVITVDNTLLKETGTNTYIYTLETTLNAYWKIISTINCSLKLSREEFFDDVNSTDPAHVIYFDMTCGGVTIPANVETEIYSHEASLTSKYGYLPISVTTRSTDNLNESFYSTTLTLTLTTE